MVTLNGWHSLEQGWNRIAHIQADLLEPIFGPGMAVPGGHRGWKRPQIGHKCSVLAIGSCGDPERVAYQCYIQDTADLRDMKGFDLPATILSSVSSLDTPYWTVFTKDMKYINIRQKHIYMSHTGKGKAPKVLQVLIYFLILFLVIWAQICPDLLQPRSTQFHQFGATRSGYGHKMA